MRSKRTASRPKHCDFIPWFLRLEVGATFLRGSYVAEPRLLLCVSQVRAQTPPLVYRRIYRGHLYRSLYCSAVYRSSLSKVRNDNVRNQDVHPHGPIRGRTVPYRTGIPCTQTCSRIPLFRYRTLSHAQGLHNHTAVRAIMTQYLHC